MQIPVKAVFRLTKIFNFMQKEDHKKSQLMSKNF